MSRMISHHSLPITAEECFWQSMGWTVFTNTDTAGHNPYIHDANQLLALGITATGANDQRVIAWAVGEHQRRAEEKTRATAIAREAEAISKLATAIQGNSDRSVIEKVMSRLTERTQYAIRQQLSGTGLLDK